MTKAVQDTIEGSTGKASLVVKNTLASVVDALTELAEWAAVFAWDEFAQRLVFRRAPPTADGAVAGAVVRERDLDAMRVWFEKKHHVVLARRTVVDAARIVGGRNAFHPVREYLTGLSWDGVPRVDTWLENFCAVRPASQELARLLRSVARKWLVSCVARAMTPGCKVDTMLILEGKQGIGKSSALAALAGPGFFCDSLIDFGNKDACQSIQGVWIYEASELDPLLRGKLSQGKAFLTRAFDKFRAPYGRAPETIPRSVVFCGTVNHGGYLKDRTGNRRFWCVACEGPMDIAGIAAHRDQLWAEARVAFEAGETWHLHEEDEALMRVEQEARVEVDPCEETVRAWTERQGEVPFTMNGVLEGALGLKAHGRNPRVTSRVSQILTRIGYERQRKAAQGGRMYQYVRASCPTAPLPHFNPVRFSHGEGE